MSLKFGLEDVAPVFDVRILFVVSKSLTWTAWTCTVNIHGAYDRRRNWLLRWSLKPLQRQCKFNQITTDQKLEMGRNLHCWGSALFGSKTIYKGSVRFASVRVLFIFFCIRVLVRIGFGSILISTISTVHINVHAAVITTAVLKRDLKNKRIQF